MSSYTPRSDASPSLAGGQPTPITAMEPSAPSKTTPPPAAGLAPDAPADAGALSKTSPPDRTGSAKLRGSPQGQTFVPRLVVLGIGGAGGNVVNNMIEAGLQDIDFMVANTDMQDLERSRAPLKVQIGAQTTQGLGTGANPAFGAQAAEESIDEVLRHLQDTHLLFITAGMGGGTGTGATGVIARRARAMGVLTFGMVTKPFEYEGMAKMRVAEEAIAELNEEMDKLIVISNQNLFSLANERTPLSEAFALADKILASGIIGITEAIMRPGLINVDFADVRTVMEERGHSVLGTGAAEGADRALAAIADAVNNRLVDDVSLRGASMILLNVTGDNVTMHETHAISERLREEAGEDTRLVLGVIDEPLMDGSLKVCVMAAGIPRAGGEAVMRSAPAAEPQPAAQPRDLTGDEGLELGGDEGEALPSMLHSDPEPPKKRGLLTGILPSGDGAPEPLPDAKSGWFSRLFGDTDTPPPPQPPYTPPPESAEIPATPVAPAPPAAPPSAAPAAPPPNRDEEVTLQNVASAAAKPIPSATTAPSENSDDNSDGDDSPDHDPSGGGGGGGNPVRDFTEDAGAETLDESLGGAGGDSIGRPIENFDEEPPSKAMMPPPAASQPAPAASDDVPAASDDVPAVSEEMTETPQPVTLPPVEVKAAPALKLSERRKAERKSPTQAPPAMDGMDEDEDEPQLEIPTFLRRQSR